MNPFLIVWMIMGGVVALFGQNVVSLNGVIPPQRIALVIGNSKYKVAPLKNPKQDAVDVAAALQRNGFEVQLGLNLNRKEMEKKIREFGAKLNHKNVVGLFYYSGHGIQINDNNYMIPIQADIQKEKDIEYEAVKLQKVLDEMQGAENPLNIILLDACRNNPFFSATKSLRQGLKAENVPSGMVISFATKPDGVALDGEGKNSPYTTAFLNVIQKENLELTQFFKEIRKEVQKMTHDKQITWEQSALMDDFYFHSVTTNINPQDAAMTRVLKKANEYFGEHKYDAAFQLFYENRNNLLFSTDDMCALAWLYQKGVGTLQNDSMNVFWLRKAASKGHGLAQANLGVAYEKGLGVIQDEKIAVEWFQKAVENGNDFGQNNLAVMYLYGKGGLQKDTQKAIYYFRLAAKQGNSLAIQNLANLEK